MYEIHTSHGKVAYVQLHALIFVAYIVSLHFVLVHTDPIHPKNFVDVKQLNVSKNPSDRKSTRTLPERYH